jgi:hypothetical protein
MAESSEELVLSGKKATDAFIFFVITKWTVPERIESLVFHQHRSKQFGSSSSFEIFGLPGHKDNFSS